MYSIDGGITNTNENYFTIMNNNLELFKKNYINRGGIMRKVILSIGIISIIIVTVLNFYKDEVINFLIIYFGIKSMLLQRLMIII